MKLLNLNDIFEGLANHDLCLQVHPNIAGQDTNFGELSCIVKDPYGITLGTFDYQLDHNLHGGNVLINNKYINPNNWYSEESDISEFIRKVINN